MLAVVKKPHTKQTLFEVKGEIPSSVLTYLEKTFGQDVEHNRRSISKEVARKLCQIFKALVERFLYGISA